MSKLKSFTIYEEYYDLITLLPDKEQANVLLAIVKYMFEDEDIQLNDRENKVFINLKRPLTKSKEQSKRRTKTKPKENQKETKTKPKEQPKRNTSNDVYVNVNGNVNNIYSFIEENFNRTLSPIEYEEISTWEDNELTRYAVKQAVLNGAYNVKYISRILQSYSMKNIKTVQEAQKSDEEFQNKKSGNKLTSEKLNMDVEIEEATEEEIRKLEERMKR